METNVTKETKKHFSKVGLILFIGTILIYTVQIIAMVIASNVPFIAGNANLAFITAMLPMYIIAFPIIFLLFKKIPSQFTGEKKKMRISHLLIALSICYAATYVCNIIGTLITTVVGIIKQSPVQNVLAELTGSINPLTTFFIIVVCAPVMEELLFRKFLISRTARYGEGVAVVLSGILFGLFHGNLNQFAYAFTLGVLFGFVYVKTQNILYPIIFHVAINFFGSFVTTLILEVSGYMELTQLTTSGATPEEIAAFSAQHAGSLLIYTLYCIMLIAFVILGIVLFFVNKKKFTFNPGEVVIEKGQRFKTVLLNVGMILYCAFWIIQIIIQLFA